MVPVLFRFRATGLTERLPRSPHLQNQLQDGSRLTFSSISFSFLTFPRAPYRIFLLYLPRLPCHFHIVVIEQQQQLGWICSTNERHGFLHYDGQFRLSGSSFFLYLRNFFMVTKIYIYIFFAFFYIPMFNVCIY